MTAPETVARLVAEINRVEGRRLEVIAGFAQGETRSAHLVRDDDGGEWVLKWSDSGPDALANLARLVRLVDSLRADGYPAPRHLTTGVLGDHAYWVQELMPGAPMHASPEAVPDEQSLLLLANRLVELVDTHAGKGDLADPPWPGWLLDTLESGGTGYCLHETMQRRADTAEMLATIKRIGLSCRGAPPRSGDIVHFDFTYANILRDASGITGVIDWNVPFVGALQGERGFDLATLLFYAYDRPLMRGRLWAALSETTPAPWSAAYLAHLTLRQVEWVMRFYPGTAQEARFLAIGHAVVEDIEGCR